MINDSENSKKAFLNLVNQLISDKDFSNLKKLTLVIPTYNRNYYLSRCLWYHAHFPFGQIIVADSSPEEKKVINRETVEEVQKNFGIDILYLEYQPETDKYGGDIYRKWHDAVGYSNTEYVQICTDKEFAIPTQLNTSIEFLESNPDYISSQGDEYGVLKLKEPTHSLTLFNRHPSRSNEPSPDARERLEHSVIHCAGFANSTLLSVMRTTVAKEIYNTYYDSNRKRNHDLRYGELFLAYGGYVLGKVHHDKKSVSRIRDEIGKYDDIKSNNGEFFCNSQDSSTTRYPTYNDYRRLGTIDLYYSSIYDSFCDLYQRNTSFSREDVEEHLKTLESKFKTVFTTEDAFLKKLWDKYNHIYFLLPIFIRKHLSHIMKPIIKREIPISKDSPNIICINEGDLSADERIIVEIIMLTDKMRQSDSVVFSTYE